MFIIGGQAIDVFIIGDQAIDIFIIGDQAMYVFLQYWRSGHISNQYLIAVQGL